MDEADCLVAKIQSSMVVPFMYSLHEPDRALGKRHSENYR